MKMNFELKRDFVEEVVNAQFKKSTYTIYNQLDDEKYIESLEKTFKEPLSIEDFEYFDIPLDEKETFLLKMRNNKINDKIKTLKNRLFGKQGVKLIVDYDNGLIRIVKLKRISI